MTGSLCRQNAFLAIQMTLGEGTDVNQTIILNSDTLSQQYFKGIKSINTLGDFLFGISPAGVKNGLTNWRQIFFFQSLSTGSLVTTVHANAGSYTDPNAATTDMNNALAGAPQNVASMISYSVSSSGFGNTTSGDD